MSGTDDGEAGNAETESTAAVEESSLTERQVEILRLREEGRTQREVAEVVGTTASNVSRVERSAERNIERARRTLQVARLVRAPVRFRVTDATSFDRLVNRIYDRGDEAGISIDYCVPELYAHLYAKLEPVARDNVVDGAIEIGITDAGAVNVAHDGSEPEP